MLVNSELGYTCLFAFPNKTPFLSSLCTGFLVTCWGMLGGICAARCMVDPMVLWKWQGLGWSVVYRARARARA